MADKPTFYIKITNSTHFQSIFSFNVYIYNIYINNIYIYIRIYRVIHKSVKHIRKLADATVE